MANITTYLEDKLLDACLRDVSYTSTHTYVALFTTNPTMPAGTGAVEVSGGAYARQQLDTALAAAAAGQSATNANLTWATANANWGTVTGIGIYDALTNGNLLWAGSLTTSETVNSGDTFAINSGNLTVSIS